MSIVRLEELLRASKSTSYPEQYAYVMEQVRAGRLKPVLSSGKNGKRPALYQRYHRIQEEEDYSRLMEELDYSIHPAISNEYYRKNPDRYKEDREVVLALSNYLKDNSGFPAEECSVNERSFEIWHREKFLSKEQGRTVLKRCGIRREQLGVYETSEPLAYYSHSRAVPQNMLIIENKDTFYTFRKHLMQENCRIFDKEFQTLIYGSGKKIYRTIQDFDLCMEHYMTDPGNRIYYFGDLDYEGIGIYELLEERVWERFGILPFTAAYEKMLEKAKNIIKLPETSRGQNRNISGYFFRFFPEKTVRQMQEILESDRYIPQEIINAGDLL